MNWLDYVSLALLAAGMFFFVAGTVALFRFPDLYCRLHALTKADNVGLGLTLLALMVQAENWLVVAKLALIWMTVLVASATVCYLIAREAQRRGLAPVEGHALSWPHAANGRDGARPSTDNQGGDR